MALDRVAVLPRATGRDRFALATANKWPGASSRAPTVATTAPTLRRVRRWTKT